jgi:hypothetical protein
MSTMNKLRRQIVVITGIISYHREYITNNKQKSKKGEKKRKSNRLHITEQTKIEIKKKRWVPSKVNNCQKSLFH